MWKSINELGNRQQIKYENEKINYKKHITNK